MSDDVIIRAENIGKRYVLNHQTRGASGQYRKFSDVLVNAAKAPLRWAQKQKAERRKQKESAQLSAFSSQLSDKEDFWALKDIDFEIKRGEVVGIIGRNGAGKSTLLKILSRITEPTTGRITLRGRVASLLEVGTGFHPELTGRENIYLNGAILGMTKAEIRSKFDEIVAFAEIEKFLDTPVKRYSSGMYVRLAFAVAAHLEPEILIVDEVLAVGDAQFQKKCLGKMQDVARGGERTVLFVSHNMGAVRSLCHTGILLAQGQLVAHGEMEQVIGCYLQNSSSSSEFRVVKNENSYITGCEVRTPGAMASETFFTSDEIEVAVRYRNERQINGLRTGFNIAQADGTILLGCTPEDEGFSTCTEPGEHEAVGRLAANHLLKGAYKINAAVWNGIDHTIYNEARDIWSFSMEAARERAYAVDTYRPGVLQVPVAWQVRSL